MGSDQMNFFEYKPVITAVDLLDAGACIQGVKDAVYKHLALVMESAKAMQISEWSSKAANADGYGYGYGYGDGDGL